MSRTKVDKLKAIHRQLSDEVRRYATAVFLVEANVDHRAFFLVGLICGGAKDCKTQVEKKGVCQN